MEKTFETKEVVIKKLVTEGLQIRVEMNEECIEKYAAKYRMWHELEDKKKLPPITVFYDVMGDEYYLADGFHRVIAAKRAGWKKITANVYEGTFDEALKFALGANATHGLKRTKEDEIHALEIVWTQWDTLYKNEKRTTSDGHPSVRQLMEKCGVNYYKANNFSNSMRVIDSITPDKKTADKDDATVATRDHTEERNPKVCALLKLNKDRFGVDIPEHIIEAFKSKKPREKMRELGRIREDLCRYHETKHPAFLHSIDYALRDLDATIHALRNGQAFCVCRMCRGKGCGSCSNFGFQTKLQYQRVPREYKAEQV